jgi:hypothetical protein
MNRIKKMEISTVQKFVVQDIEFMDKIGEGKIL